MTDTLTAQQIEALFTRSDGTYLFARWGRALAPVVFGVEDSTIDVIRSAFAAVTEVATHEMMEADPQFGANVMMFFCRDWAELTEVPNLDRLIPDLDALVGRLTAAQANQYRIFRFDPQGAICACFILLRMDDDLSAVPAETLALSQVAQSMLLWSDVAFGERSPLGQLPDGRVILRPEIGLLLRAAYDPVMPVVARDPSHALRLAARVQVAS